MNESPILNRHPDPDMRCPRQVVSKRCESIGAFSENLVDVQVGRDHDFEHIPDVSVRYALVEKIAHRIHEDSPGTLPLRGKAQSFGPDFQVKALLIRVPLHSTESFSKCLRIT